MRRLYLLLAVLAMLSSTDITNGQTAHIAHIYVADSGNNRIVRMTNMLGTGWKTFGSSGDQDNQFNRPTNLFVDIDQGIFIVDYSNGRIVHIDDMNGKDWIAFDAKSAKLGDRDAPFVGIQQVSVDNDRHIVYLQDSRIMRIDDMSGRNWTPFGSDDPLGQHGSGYFYAVRSFAQDRLGRFYVADATLDRIVRMDDLTGRNLVYFGSPGSEQGQFSYPSLIFLDRLDRIYIADYGNHRIVRMDDMTGKNWMAFGSPGRGKGQFGKISGLFVDKYFRVFVTDFENNRVVRLDNINGSGWTTFGGEGSGWGLFHGPSGIFVR